MSAGLPCECAELLAGGAYNGWHCPVHKDVQPPSYAADAVRIASARASRAGRPTADIARDQPIPVHPLPSWSAARAWQLISAWQRAYADWEAHGQYTSESLAQSERLGAAVRAARVELDAYLQRAQAPTQLEFVPLTGEEIQLLDDNTHFHESPDWNARFARAVEACVARRLGIQPAASQHADGVTSPQVRSS